VKKRETFGGAEGDEVQTGSQASSWWLRRTVLYEGVAGDDHLCDPVGARPARSEDRRVHQAAAVCQLGCVADLFGACVRAPV
jgi:hypothetical protein